MSTTIEPIAPRKKGKSTRLEALSVKGRGRKLRASGAVVKVSNEALSVDHLSSRLVGRVTGSKIIDRTGILAKIRNGLAFKSIEMLEEALNSTRKEMSVVLSIPVSTLNRRKKEGVLHVDESDRVVRFAQLFDSAVIMMQGDKNAAITWLRTSSVLLNNESPLEHASTELGAKDVEDLIGRIQHGVFS